MLAAWLARRIGGTRLLVVAMGAVLLLERSMGADVFTRPWNPFLALLPFLAFLFAAWGSLAGSGRFLPWMIFAGSVAAQSQVAFGPAVAAIGLVVFAIALTRTICRRRRGGRSELRWMGAAFAVAGVCWALPIYQQITADRGNLTRLADWALHGETARIGLVRGLRPVIQVLGHLPLPIADFGDSKDPTLSDRPSVATWCVALAVVAALAAIVVVKRRRTPVMAIGALLALGSVAAAVVLASQVVVAASTETYQFLSLWLAASFAWAVLGWAAAESVRSRLSSWMSVQRHRPVVHGSAAIGLLALAGSIVPGTLDPVITGQERRYDPVIAATIDALDGRSGPYLVSCTRGSHLSLCATMILALESHGISVVADRNATSLYGPDIGWRLSGPHDELPIIYVDRSTNPVAPSPGDELIAGPGRNPGRQRLVTEVVRQLDRAQVRIADSDVEPLRAARQSFLWIRSGDGWFAGSTAGEWNQLIGEDTRRFVESGGLTVLTDAGVLAAHPDLRATAQRLVDQPELDSVWLSDPTKPPGTP